MEATMVSVGGVVTLALVVFNLLAGLVKKTSAWPMVKDQIDPIRVALGAFLAVGMSKFMLGMTPEMMVAASSGFAAGSWAANKVVRKKKG